MAKATVTMTDEHKKQLKSAAWRVWEITSGDVYACCAEMEEKLTEAGARESVIEYLDFHGKFDPFAHGYTYDQVNNFLKKEVRFT